MTGEQGEQFVANNALRLRVRGNVSWNLSSNVSGTGADHLEVTLDKENGNKPNELVWVSYRLFDLLELNPGDYTVTVTFTATTQ